MNVEKYEDWIRSHSDCFIDLVRIYLGAGLMIKGVFFLMHPTLLNGLFSIPGIEPYVHPLHLLVPGVHIVGGLLLALGLAVRFAAVAQLPILFGAAFLVNFAWMDTFQVREAFEFSSLVLFLMVVIALKGPGRLSLHAWLRRSSPRAANPYQRWVNEHADLFPDLIRIYLGIGLLMKGLYFMDHRDDFAGLFDQSSGMALGVIMVMHYAIPAHFAGGVALASGLLTRFAAFVQLPLLAGAVFFVYLPSFSTLELRQNLEFTALVLFLLLLFTVQGSGRFSLDYSLRKSDGELPAPHPAV